MDGIKNRNKTHRIVKNKYEDNDKNTMITKALLFNIPRQCLRCRHYCKYGFYDHRYIRSFDTDINTFVCYSCFDKKLK